MIHTMWKPHSTRPYPWRDPSPAPSSDRRWHRITFRSWPCLSCLLQKLTPSWPEAGQDTLAVYIPCICLLGSKTILHWASNISCMIRIINSIPLVCFWRKPMLKTNTASELPGKMSASTLGHRTFLSSTLKTATGTRVSRKGGFVPTCKLHPRTYPFFSWCMQLQLWQSEISQLNSAPTHGHWMLLLFLHGKKKLATVKLSSIIPGWKVCRESSVTENYSNLPSEVLIANLMEAWNKTHLFSLALCSSIEYRKSMTTHRKHPAVTA